jgi:hypothetical protein
MNVCGLHGKKSLFRTATSQQFSLGKGGAFEFVDSPFYLHADDLSVLVGFHMRPEPPRVARNPDHLFYVMPNAIRIEEQGGANQLICIFRKVPVFVAHPQ